MTCRKLLSLTVLLFAGLAAAPHDAAGATLSEEEIHDTYSQAKKHFRQANEVAEDDPQAARELYRKAALRFERLVRDGGIRNGKLYYNIGNAYFRLGDIGRAILNYRRAQHYMPNDPNLLQNLAYARSRRKDKIEPRQETEVLETILFFHYDLSPRARSVIFVVCFLAFWGLLALRLFRPGAAPRWAMVVLGAGAAIFLASLIADTMARSQYQPGVVLDREAVARKGDGPAYERAFKEPLHAGTEFNLLEAREDWVRVELHDGRTCWLPRDAIGLVQS